MNFSTIKIWLAGLAVMALVGCGGGGASTSEAGAPGLGGGPGGSGGTVTALFTTAPSALTLRAADSTESFAITGGVAPYTVTASNPAVAAVVFAGTSFKISGVADGVASVAVKDAAGASVLLTVTVTAPLLTTAPTTLTLRPADVSPSYAVSGGKLSYTAATSNAAVATVALTGSSFKVTGVANGSAAISVKDAAGAEVILSVTVAAPLFSTAPSTLTLRAADTTEAYAINGGKAPYVVVSSNMAVATVMLATPNTFKISGVTNGITTVYVIDDTGAQIPVGVSVYAPLFSTAPATLILPTGSSSEPYALSGGKAPYSVISASPAVVSVSAVLNNKYTISALKDGSADVYVTDADGARLITSVVASTSSVALFTTAPTAVTLRASGQSDSYTISGGKAPYTTVTSNTSVVTVLSSGSNNSTFVLTGGTDGVAVVTITDSAGKQLTVGVTVSTNSAALFSTAPSTLTLRPGASSDLYAISGGKAPYSVVTSNAALVAVTQTASTFRITGVANGTAAVSVKDSAGAEVLVTTTIASSLGVLFTTAPSSLVLPTSVTSDSYTVSGGTAPYTVASSNPAVATVFQAGSVFTIRGVVDGLAVVTAKDATGLQAQINVTVSSQVVALFTTAPASLSLRASGLSSIYAISGGRAPYVVVTANSAVAAAALTDSTHFQITGVGDGSAAVYIKDASGVQVLVNVTVLTSVGPLFSTAPGALTMAVSMIPSEAYAISGGVAPYTVTSSNPAVATVGRSGNTFTVTGVGAGVATVHIKDVVGAEVQVTVTVISNAAALFTTAPAILTVGVGQITEEYIVSGGRSPYSLASNNVAIASVGINGSRFVITGVAGGHASVVLKDSLGSTLTLDVSVGAAAALFTTAPSPLNLAITVTRSFVIAGGAAPYTASTSDSSIATVTVAGTALAVTAVKPGIASIFVKDAINGQVQIQVTVPSSPTPVPAALFTTAPTTASLKVAPGTRPTFTIGGGTAPYAVQTNNLAVTGVSLLGTTTLEIFGAANGSAVVAVTDAVGAHVEIAVDVTGANVVALYTTAPAGLTVVSASSRNVEIGGGVGPYLVNSANISNVTVTVSGSTATVTALSAGTAVVSVFDSLGSSVSFPVTVPATAALFTTAPSVLSAAPGSTLDFVIGGGAGPYIATSSNAGVAVSSVPGGSPNTLRLVAGVAGSAQVVVRDSVGTTLQVQVVVTAVALGTSAPGNINLVSGSSATFYGVTGGMVPYSIASSDASVVTATPVTQTGVLYSFSATGVRPGTAVLVLRDANNASVTVDVTVSTTAILAVSAPATVTLQPSGTAASYTISGGLAPYFAVSADAAIASVAVVGSTLSVTPAATGSTTVVVRDSLGGTVNLTVIVGSATALFTSATPNVAIASGSVGSYTVGGGAGPYSAVSSNQAVATATLAGTALTVNGVVQGNAAVQVRDAAGGLVTINVTVAPGLALFTSAPATITVLPATTYSYLIGGGTAPYRIDSSNTAIATVIANSASLNIAGVIAGSAVVQVTDAVGAKLSVAVTVTPAASNPLTVTPESVAASVGDSLNFVISGGDPFGTAPPYTVTVQNTSLMTASSASTVAGLTTFSAALINTGATTVIVTDSKGQTKVIALTITNVQPLLRLSPSMIEISENFSGVINFYVSGGEGLLTAYTSRVDLSSVPAAPFGVAVLPATSVAVPVGLGSTGNRCVSVLDGPINNDHVDVTITVADDKTGRSATSILRIKDNRGACP